MLGPAPPRIVVCLQEDATAGCVELTTSCPLSVPTHRFTPGHARLTTALWRWIGFQLGVVAPGSVVTYRVDPDPTMHSALDAHATGPRYEAGHIELIHACAFEDGADETSTWPPPPSSA